MYVLFQRIIVLQRHSLKHMQYLIYSKIIQGKKKGEWIIVEAVQWVRGCLHYSLYFWMFKISHN